MQFSRLEIYLKVYFQGVAQHRWWLVPKPFGARNHEGGCKAAGRYKMNPEGSQASGAGIHDYVLYFHLSFAMTSGLLLGSPLFHFFTTVPQSHCNSMSNACGLFHLSTRVILGTDYGVWWSFSDVTIMCLSIVYPICAATMLCEQGQCVYNFSMRECIPQET